MSWTSTEHYYRGLNELVQQRLGAKHSAQLLLYSVDFAQIAQWQRRHDWACVAEYLTDIARRLELAGCDLLGLCSNTIHQVADDIAAKIDVPVVQITSSVAEKISDLKLKRVAVLGTRYVMAEGFYRQRIETSSACESVVPSVPDQEWIHSTIFDELCHGTVNSSIRRRFRQMIGQLCDTSIDGVLLACTELGLAIDINAHEKPVLDSTQIHIQALGEAMLND